MKKTWISVDVSIIECLTDVIRTSGDEYEGEIDWRE